MAPWLLAAALWRAPAPFTVAHGEARRLVLPAVAGPARLVLCPRADYPRFAGSNPFLRVELNGEAVGPMRDRQRTRLASVAPIGGGPARFESGLWRIAYGPACRARDEIVLDVSDLLRPDAENVLVLEHGPATSAGPTPLAVDELRLEAAAVRGAPASARPDWVTPRLRRPSPPRFTAEGDAVEVRIAWTGGAAAVRSAVHGGRHAWGREIILHPTHAEVRDTIGNPTDELVALRIRHAVATRAAWLHLGGRPDPELRDTYAPWNPTVFTPVGTAGLGLVAEDDVFREQLHVDFDPESRTLGLRTDMLCLGPGERYTLVWSIYPTRTDSYWDFINTVRADWGVNRTVPGSYVWFSPDRILAMPAAQLRAALGRQRVAIASMWGGWVDPERRERPARIGFGTAVLGDEFAALRGRIGAAVQKLKEVRPGITVLLYFDAQRDSSPDAPERYADSLLLGHDGRAERTDWGGRFSPTWGMIPTAGNRFGRTMHAVARAMRALGADGLYWDEMDGVDYGGPRVTRAAWDGRSCTPGSTRKLGLANLLGEDAKLAYAAVGTVLGNTPPTTRRFQARPDLRMVEAQHNRAWGAFAHLTTPLGYIGDRSDWGMVVEKIEEPLLVAGTRLDYDYELPARLFPLTPEYIQPGTLRGRERIVTVRSATHGWLVGGGDVRAFRYDAMGREHRARWRVKRRGDAVLVRVRLGRGEVAVIERRGIAHQASP